MAKMVASLCITSTLILSMHFSFVTLYQHDFRLIASFKQGHIFLQTVHYLN